MADSEPSLWKRLLPLMVLLSASALAAPSAAQDAPAKLAEKPVKSLGSTENAQAGTLLVSSNGDHLAYRIWGEKDGKMWVRSVCDGVQGPIYGRTLSPTLSPDGKHFAYYAEIGTRVLVVCDGREMPYDALPCLAFSPDSRHFAYNGRLKSGDGVMVRDGVPGKFLATCSIPVFSPDSRHLAYASGNPKKRSVVVDDSSGAVFDDVGEPVFSPDGAKLAYAFCKDNKWGIVSGAVRRGPYDEVGMLVFSTAGSVLAFKARRDKQWFVVGDKGKELLFDDVRDPVLSLLGDRVAYAATDRKSWFIVCDGKRGPGYAEVGDPAFSPDGKHLAYRAVKDGKAILVCDGKESPPVEEIKWVGFSPDGKHLAAAVARDKKYRLACDGVEGPPHETLLVPQRYDEVAGKMRYVVIDKNEASLVEIDWPADRTWEDAFKSALK